MTRGKTNQQSKTWIDEQGHFFLTFKRPLLSKGRLWMGLLVIILCIAFLLTRMLASIQASVIIGLGLIVLAFIVLTFIVFYCLIRQREKKEENIISNAADTYIKESILRQFPVIDGLEICEIRRSFYYHYVGQYGAYDKSYILSRLSNNHILAFECSRTVQPEEYGMSLCELCPPQETNDEEHIKAVTSHIPYVLSKLKAPSNFRLNLLLLIILSIGLGLITFLVWLLWYLQVYFIVVVGIYVICLWLFTRGKNEKTKSNVVDKIGRIMLLPLVLVQLFIKPTICILFGYLVLFSCAFVTPIVVITLLNQIFAVGLSLNTIIFLVLTSGFIIGVHGSRIVHSEIRRMSSHIIRRNGTREEQMMEGLALYVVQRSTIKFFIYFAYLVFICIMGYKNIQYGIPVLSAQTDNAIVTSFLVFIAYTNMVVNSHEVEVSSKELYRMIIKVVSGE